MIREHSHRAKRSAFTLVELMVVILIIAILVSLLASATFKALGKIGEVQTSTEIAEMSVALQAFMMDYNLTEPPPSKLVLYENIGLYTTPPTSTFPGAAQSYMFLKQMFGKSLGSLGFIGWSGQPPTGTGAFVLEGEQCLVFYLGGIPSVTGPQGFSTNNMNPSAPSTKRKGPYFNFVASRLKPPLATAVLAPTFPVYVDPWQTKSGPFYAAPTTVPGVTLGGAPYVYFSSSGNNNGYSYTDCSGVTFFDILGRPQVALPYYTAVSPLVPGLPTAYNNSNLYQIISAGKDGTFGYNLVPPSPIPPPPAVLPLVISNNNLWLPTSGALGTGFDDQSNFSSTVLGAGQN